LHVFCTPKRGDFWSPEENPKGNGIPQWEIPRTQRKNPETTWHMYNREDTTWGRNLRMRRFGREEEGRNEDEDGGYTDEQTDGEDVTLLVVASAVGTETIMRSSSSPNDRFSLVCPAETEERERKHAH
jgi:hypothetical protein